MVVCATGSTKQAGAPDFVHVDLTYIQSFLPVQLAWLVPFLPYIPAVDLDLNVFCSADPPPNPTIDATDLINLVKPSKITLAIAAADKLLQLIQAYAWYRFCKCNGTTPAAPTPPSVPTGAPALNPGGFVTLPTSTGPCLINYQASYDSPATTTGTGFDYSQITYGTNNVQTLRAHVNHVIAGASHGQIVARIDWFKTGPVLMGASAEIPINPNQKQVLDFPVLPGSVRGDLVIRSLATSTDLVGGYLEAYCDVPPGSTGVCQCGPDTRSLGLLSQIYALLTSVQRFGVPFGYISGTVHSGLTGDGHFTIADQIGLLVEVTTVPSRVTEIAGDPIIVFDVGSIAIGTADGWNQRKEIRHAQWVWLPTGMQAMTKVGYSVPSDCVVKITELQAEAP
jgi:hypothetical protein